jgi:hypothetical protein
MISMYIESFLRSRPQLIWAEDFMRDEYIIHDIRTGTEMRIPGEMSHGFANQMKAIERIRQFIENIGPVGITESEVSKNQGRISEINEELDIIKGRVPTPKGYTINKTRAKLLMAELQRLTRSTQV